MAIKPEKITKMRKNVEELSPKIEAVPGYTETSRKFGKE